jgi:hypothetical protein
MRTVKLLGLLLFALPVAASASTWTIDSVYWASGAFTKDDITQRPTAWDITLNDGYVFSNNSSAFPGAYARDGWSDGHFSVSNTGADWFTLYSAPLNPTDTSVYLQVVETNHYYGIVFDDYNDGTAVQVIAPPTSVPEPATLALFGLGLAAVGFMRRKLT